MNIKIVFSVLISTLIPLSSFSASEHSHQSEYVGQEKREIKSLSKSDIEELENGRGWGLAKAAELNGVPGPIHLLELKNEIGLNPEQTEKIEILYQKMKKQAIPLGLKLIELERKLNNHFANKAIDENLLHDLLEQIAQVQKRLRYEHLSTHLKTPAILTAEQIKQYNKLRGYSLDDPCKNIPKGHDPEMWRRHNNCQ
jgi:Spy/CpxP family protein refolding chaperone